MRRETPGRVAPAAGGLPPPLVAGELAQLRLELGGEEDDLGLFVMRLDRGAQLIEPGAAARREVVLVDVRGVQDRLGGEQAQLAEEPHAPAALARPAPAPPRGQLLHPAPAQYDLRPGPFSP